MVKSKITKGKARELRNKPTVEPIVTYYWLQQQFNAINHKLDLLLARPATISAELEAAINKTSALARSIDRKVLDSKIKPKEKDGLK